MHRKKKRDDNLLLGGEQRIWRDESAQKVSHVLHTSETSLQELGFNPKRRKQNN
jgi:hypothetical protein